MRKVLTLLVLAAIAVCLGLPLAGIAFALAMTILGIGGAIVGGLFGLALTVLKVALVVLLPLLLLWWVASRLGARARTY